jgi:hypothetical protein
LSITQRLAGRVRPTNLDQLLGNVLHFQLGERLVVLQYLEELALGELSDDGKAALRLESVQHHDDVVMVEVAQDVNLLPEASQVLLGFPVLRYELQRAMRSTRGEERENCTAIAAGAQ